MTTRPILAVINPNTDVSVTRFMVAIAAEAVGSSVDVVGRTASVGPPLITNERDLARAADEAVREGEAAAAAGAAAILVAAFGDPGVDTLRQRLALPVTGIAEAAVAQAGAQRRRFSIVTTTPQLERSIVAAVERYGLAELLVAVRITPGDVHETMAAPGHLAGALLAQCRLTIAQDGAEAIVIGGGPLALAARAIERQVDVPLIEPVRAGARLAARRLRGLPRERS